VTWCPWDALELRDYLGPITREEFDEYHYNIPLIFFHVVEIHLPIRVCRQFERIIGYLPPLYSTNCEVRVVELTIVLLQV
jgi:hypothetical protein